MRNRILSFLLMFCAFTITLNAQQYGKIVDYKDAKVVMNQEKQDLNMNTFVPFKSNEAMSAKVSFISESFDTEIPATWTINNTGVGTYPGWLWADTWAGNPMPLTGFAVIDSDENGSGNATAGELITPAFDCAGAAGLKLEFTTRYNDITAGGGDFFAVDVWDGTAWVNVATWDEDHGTADEAEQVSIDITAYASDSCLVRFVYDDAGAWAWYAGVDNVVIFEPDPTNLRALSLLGSPFAVEGQEKTFEVVIENIGTESVLGADYNINLVDTAGTLLSTVAGVDIDPTVIDTIAVSFTPAVADTIAILGVIDYADDADVSDNETDVMELAIQSEGTFVAQVGEDETFPPSRIPFDFYYKNSASQTIYTSNQLGIGGGVIEAIAYENSFNTDLSAGKPVKIWIGETTETDLTNGWVDPSTLTLVYDDTLVLPAGVNTIPISLTTPYVYTGGNLVVYTYRVFEDEYYSLNDKFYGTEIPDANCTRRNSSDTEFPDDLSTVDGTVISWVPNTTLFFSTEGLGSVTGTITNTGVPIEGVTVKVVDGYATTMTDGAGEYMFPYLLAGDYELALDKFGFEPDTILGITVLENDTVVADGTIDSIATYAVSGTIISSDLLAGIEGAAVTLDGYEMYLDSTDVSGMFMIEGVYGGTREYVMTVTYPGYSTYVDTITVVDADLTGVDVTLEEIPYPVAGVNAEVNTSDEAVVTWLAPGSMIPAEFRYDNGIQTGQLGSSTGTDNTVLGSVHRVNAQLHEVSWFTTAEGGPHATVNVFIFDLDETGAPTNTVLYSAMAVENTDMEWTVHELPEPVDAPNGFMIAMSYAGFAGLGTTDPDDDYPYTLNTHYYSGDYTGGDFATVESLGDPTLEKPFMIRAYGYNLGKSKAQPSFAYSKAGNVNHNLELITNSPFKTDGPAFSMATPSKELVDYTVYRLNEGDEMVNWVEVGTAVTDTFYVDADWTNQAFGLYQFAVVANYTNSVMSDPTLSNVIAKDMTVDYTVNISTNASDDATGAVVTLTNQDADPEHVYMMTADANGVVFDSVWRGVYDMTIEKAAFDLYTANSVVIEEGGLSMDVELIETIVEPYSLSIEQNGYNANFSWNGSFGGSVLVVDHDASNGVDFTDDWVYIQPVLDANEVSYTYYEADATSYNGPDLTTMQEYDAIIWFTGEGWQNGQTLTSTDETNLASYLDGGGKLFLSSQDYIWDVYSQADTYTFSAGQFPYDYLGLVSVAQDTWWQSGGESLVHQGATGSLAEGFTFTCDDIYTTTKEGLSCDQITDHNAMNMLTITSDPQGSVAIQNGNVVFWAGSFASVTDEQIRGDLLMAILDYLATGKKTHNTKVFESYSVYLDDMITPVVTGITDSTYQFTDLAVGTYTAGVKAVYESGESSIVELDFEIVEPTYVLTFNVMDDVTSNIMEGVTVEVTDGTDTWTYTTDANGQAVFDCVNGVYDYTVSMTGYETMTGQVTIDNGPETVDIMMPVGISETSIAGFSVYPNPSQGSFTVKADAVGSIVVLDAVGQIVMEKDFNDATTIDLTNAAGGIYFIRLMTDSKVDTKRIVIE